MLRRLIPLVPFCIALLSAGPAAAEVYRWVDEAGKVHFGDRPPDAGAETLDLPDASVQTDIGADRAERRERVLEVLQQDRLEKQRQREAAAAASAERAEKCRRLQKYYERHSTASGVYRKDKDGNREYYSSEERAAAEQKMRRAMEKNCN
jgi:hypothetical protein